MVIAKDCKVNYNEPFDPLKGVKATDNVDGDITDRISVINNVTGNLVGSFRVEYKVEDSSGNQTTVYRAVTVSTQCLPNTLKRKIIIA